MFIKLPKTEIKDIISSVESLSENIKDEMAIPSYMHKNPLINYLMWKRYQVIYNLISPINNKFICEFGCGIGLFLPTISRESSNIYAIDIYPYYAKKLSEKHKLNVNFIDSIDKVEDRALDIIIAADVMEHLKKPEDYIVKFYNKLRQNGKLIISGPTENIIYKLGRIVAGFGDKGDYHNTNINRLKNLILSYKFRLEEVKNLPFFIPPHLFKILRFEKV